MRVFEGAFKGGGGDVGCSTQVVVADTAGALACLPDAEAKVNGLFSRAEVGED